MGYAQSKTEMIATSVMQPEVSRSRVSGRSFHMLRVAVPHKEQSVDNTCGPNTLAMLSQYFNKETVRRDTVPGYAEIINQHGMVKTGFRRFCQTFEQITPGYTMSVRSLPRHEIMHYIVDQISAGVPVAFAYPLKNRTGRLMGIHYSIVNGVEASDNPAWIEITDGRYPRYTERIISAKEFLKRACFDESKMNEISLVSLSTYWVGLFNENVLFHIEKEGCLDGPTTVSDLEIPPEAKQNATLGLRYVREFQYGGTQTGWDRAKQLSAKDSVSVEDVDEIWAWFQRHSYYKSYHRTKPEPSPSYISWLLWGGDAMFTAVKAHRRKRNMGKLNGLGLAFDGAATENSLRKKATETGIPFTILLEVYRRGVGAYKTNFSAVRPWVKKLPEEQGKAVWASGRVNRFIHLFQKGGWESVYKPDQDLAIRAEKET